MFTAGDEVIARVKEAISCPVTVIGEITDDKTGRVALVDGQGRPTGLAITPQVDFNPDGQALLRFDRWGVTVVNEGILINPRPLPSAEVATRLAFQLLAFDWTQPLDSFTSDKLRQLEQIVAHFLSQTPNP